MSEGILTRSRANSQPNPYLYAPIDFGKLRKEKKTQVLSDSDGTEREITTMSNGDGDNPTPLDNKKEGEAIGIDPKDITPETWLNMFNKLNSTLAALQTQITDLQSVKEKVNDYSSNWKESVDHSIVGFDSKNDNQDFQIKLLMNMIINLEDKVHVLESRVSASYKRELKPNIIIHGITEKKEETQENIIDAVAKFFKEQMEITQDIEIVDAFRIGQGSFRPLLLKLKHPNDKSIIFTNASNLKEKQNEKKNHYFVHDDMTEEQSETRQFYRDLVKENKDQPSDQQLKIKMQKGQIQVNNNIVKPKVLPPTKAEIIRLDPDELEKIRAVKMIKGPEHEEKGSEYVAYGIKIKSISDVRKAYKKLKVKHADATHVSCAYRLQNPVGPYRQEAVDDNDIGIGRAMLKKIKEKEMSEIAIFVVRYYGGVHLGKRRFEIAEYLTERTVQAIISKDLQKRKRSQRQVSSGTLSQVSQDSQEESEEEL